MSPKLPHIFQVELNQSNFQHYVTNVVATFQTYYQVPAKMQSVYEREMVKLFFDHDNALSQLINFLLLPA